MFGKSIQSLQEELRDLKSQSDSKAMDLVGRGVNSDQVVKDLMPINRRVVALRNQIRRKTPWKELVARRDEVQKKLNTLSPSNQLEKLQLQAEFADLDHYLKFSKRKPVTWITLLLFAAILLFIFGSRLIIDMVAP
jgi:uncharacterized coiled-coil DUF342 family protein